ncbi:hypothetical protein GCM10028824_27420 [Hymenobacter segetis]|uniref:Choice-of-anchor D domain-containing protein n=1 Tax=Hymenobacter segetis TaxID=2025509 RepID=A0ABU9M123_9BACT
MKNRYHLPVSWLALFLLLVPGFAARAQAPAWQMAVVANTGSTVDATATNAAGDVFITGTFTDVLRLGNLTLTKAAPGTGDTDVFVAKWSATSQSFVWGQQGGSLGADAASDIAVQGTNVYISGVASGIVTMGNITLSGVGPMFVAKLTDAGTAASFVWVQQTNNSYPAALVASGSSVYVGGTFMGATVTFGATTLTNATGATNQGDAFVAKLTDAGATATWQWALGAGGNLNDNATGLALNGTSVYVVGNFASARLSMGATTLAQTGSHAAFVAKIADAGSSAAFAWARQPGGYADAQAVAANGSSLYMVGSYATRVSFGQQLLDAGSRVGLYVAKLVDAGPTGDFAWAEGGTATTAAMTAVAVSGANVYATGSFQVDVTFGATTLTEVTYNDIFVTKVVDAGANGQLAWAQRTGGAGNDEPAGLAVVGTTVYVGATVGPPINIDGHYVNGTNNLPGRRAACLATLADLPLRPTLASVAPRTGPVGSTLVLTGTNLGGATAITFAGAGSPAVRSGFVANAAGTQLSGVVVPAGATSGLLSVTTPEGTTAGVPFAVSTTPGIAPPWQLLSTATGEAEVNATVADAAGNVYVAGTFQGTVVMGGTTLVSAGNFDVFVAKWTPTGGFVWAQRAGGSTADKAEAVALQGSSVYVTGEFDSATAAFGSQTLTNSDGYGQTPDMFVAKLTDAGSTGSFVWALRAGSNALEWGDALAVSGSNVYVGGDFSGVAATFGSTAVVNVNDAGAISSYVAKITDAGASGSFTWAYQVGRGNNVAALAASGTSVYMTGLFINSVTIGASTILTNGSADMYVAKLTDAGSTGSFVWAQGAGGPLTDEGTALAVQGNAIYVGGNFRSTVAYFGTATVENANHAADIFVTKLTDAGASGSFVWTERAGGTGDDLLYGLAASGSSLYVAGTYGTAPAAFGPATLPTPTGLDGYVAKLADAGEGGTFLWAKAFGGTRTDVAYTVAANGTNVYAGGYSVPLSTFDGLTIPANVNGAYRPYLVALNDASAPVPVLTAISPASGGAGTVLTLTGTNLTGTSAVAFAGTGAAVVSSGLVVNAAGTQITGVVVPGGAATGTVTATAPGGTSNGLPFTLTGPPANDDPAGALPLVAGPDCTPVSGTSAAATASTTTGLSTPAPAHDVFYTFVATSPAVRVQLTSAATTLALELYRGPATALSLVTTTSPPAPAGTLLLASASLTVGQSYVVRVTAETGGTGQPFALCVTSLPTVITLAPTSGPVGTVVTLTGTGLNAANSVRFGGGSTVPAAAFLTATATSVRVAVPTGAVSGALAVATPAGTITTAQVFTVTAPQLAVAQGSTAYPSGGAAYSFASQVVGTSSAAVRFTLSNPGSGALTLAGVSITGDFALGGSAGSSIAAGGTTSVDITFTPLAVGTRTGSLIINSDAGTYVLSLTGTARLPLPVLTTLLPTNGSVGTQVNITGSGLAGATSVNFNGVAQATITNNGGYYLTVLVPAGVPLGAGPVTVTTPAGTSNALTFTVTPPPPSWQTAVGANQAFGSMSGARALATDASGNVYVSGILQGTVTLGSTTVTSPAGTGYVAKWSRATGTFVWVQALGVVNANVAAIALNGSSVYLTGVFSGTLTLGTTTLSSSTTNLYVAKLMDAGTSASFAWARQGTTTGGATASAVGVSGTSVYVAGAYDGAPLTLGSTTLPTPANSASDVFVAKLTDAGSSASFVWAKKAGGTGEDVATSLAVSGANVYVAGPFASTAAAFGTTVLAGGFATYFVAKLTDAGSTGDFIWARQTQGGASNQTPCVAVSGANVYLAGSFRGTIRFDALSLTAAGGTDIFVAKLADAGTTSSFGWAQRAGGDADEYGTALAANSTGVYVAGANGSRLSEFGPYTLQIINNSYDTDVFVTRITDQGSTARFEWVQSARSDGTDNAYALALNGSTVYVAGEVQAGARFSAFTLTGPLGNGLAFLASLNDPVPTATAATTSLRATDDLVVYPNPAHHTATARLPLVAGAAEARLSVLDALGRTLRTQVVPLPAPGQRAELNLVGLPTGVYVVQLVAGGRTATRRLVVE